MVIGAVPDPVILNEKLPEDIEIKTEPETPKAYFPSEKMKSLVINRSILIAIS